MSKYSKGLIRRQEENVTGPGMDFEKFEADVIRQVSLACSIPIMELVWPIPSNNEQIFIRLYGRCKRDADL